jgi:hypothetical protein
MRPKWRQVVRGLGQGQTAPREKRSIANALAEHVRAAPKCL